MWPEAVVRQFNIIPRNSTESQFHAPYNKFLHAAFTDCAFMVAPKRLSDPCNHTEVVTLYEVLFAGKPVFFLQSNPLSHLETTSERRQADIQVRNHMKSLAGK